VYDFTKEELAGMRRGWVLFAIMMVVIMFCEHTLERRFARSEIVAVGSTFSNQLSGLANEMSNERQARQQADATLAALKLDFNEAKRASDAKLAELRQARDKAELALEPWKALAAKIETNAPVDQRLDFLLQRVESLIRTFQVTASRLPTKRILTAEALARVRGKFLHAPRVPIILSCPLGDQEAFALATQIKTTLQDSGFKVDGVNQSVWSQPFQGLSARCKDKPHPLLMEGLLQIYVELGLPPILQTNAPLPESTIGLDVGAH
jgi:hypothetical protein